VLGLGAHAGTRLKPSLVASLKQRQQDQPLLEPLEELEQAAQLVVAADASDSGVASVSVEAVAPLVKMRVSSV
jgi:hypothetical protein